MVRTPTLRPYSKFKVAELEQIFAAHQNDLAVLEQLAEELAHRTTNRAQRLLRRVQECRDALIGSNTPGAPIGQGELFVSPAVATPASPRPPTTAPIRRQRADGGNAPPPDDRHLPHEFVRIAKPGVRGRPDPYQPALKTDVRLDLPPGAGRIQRFIAALAALIVEMRREGTGNRRYELENGVAIAIGPHQQVYTFYFTEEAEVFEDAEVELVIDGRRTAGQIVSLSGGKIVIAVDDDFGPVIERCVLIIDNTALLEALKKRLEEAGQAQISLSLNLAESVVSKDGGSPTAQPIAAPKDDHLVASQRLNTSQRQALEASLGRAIFYVWGPPGTGKTKTLSAYVQAAFEAGKRILVTSNTNQAVDQVLLKLCRLLGPDHRAMVEGRILRLGRIANADLGRDFADFVTADGIVARRSQDLRKRQSELEAALARIDQEAAITERLLALFDELDRAHEHLSALRGQIETLAANGKAAVAARDQARADATRYGDELDRYLRAGPLRRAFMRSEAQIQASQTRAAEEAQRQDQTAQRLLDEYHAGRERRDRLAASADTLTDRLKGQDRKQLQNAKAVFQDRRNPMLAELLDIARKLADLEASILRDARVIGATVTKSYLQARDIGRFDAVVIDEASMVLLPALYIVAALSTERVLISGDFRQLPPIVPSRQQAIHDEIGHDVFEVAGLNDTATDDPRRIMLELQYRMVDGICELISQPMYEGNLKTSSNPKANAGPRAPELVERALTIVDTSRLWPFESRNAFGSRFNLLHALLVRNLAVYLHQQAFDGPGAVGVCTPYAAQAKLIHRLLSDSDLSDRITAGTVHRFQGDEKRMIVLDIPESIGPAHGIGLFVQGIPKEHVGARVMNVAVSRAQEHLVVIANLTYLDPRLPSTALLRHVLYDMQERGKVIDGNEILALRPIDQDLKSLLGIVELDLDAQKLGLFRGNAFADACLIDMKRAERTIVIFSGFVTPERVATYSDLFRAKQADGVKVRCVTRPPRFNGSMDPQMSKAVLDALEAVGAVVDCRRAIHEKVVLIDNRIVWWGSLNALSHTARTDEVMTRVESPSYAEQVAAFLSKRRGLSATAAVATVADAENPRCPRCGSRTYYSEGRYGRPPYFSCEDEDGCRWRESAHQTWAGGAHQADGDSLPQLGPPCPKCGGPSVLRFGSRGPFYGCADYPRCDGTVNPPRGGGRPRGGGAGRPRTRRRRN